MKINTKRVKLSPAHLGCWFCGTALVDDDGEINDEDMVYDYEFDTNVHKECIKRKLAEDSEHPEADLMRYLIGEKQNEN